MKKNILSVGAFILISATVSAQVGVNTGTPYSTMDVRAKRDSGGNIIDNTQLIGLQAPRITLAELTANTATYGTSQQGALVYITDISGGNTSGQRANIDEVGYYSFNGSLWQKVLFKNIYNSDGSLVGSGIRRTLNVNGKELSFEGTSQRTFWSANGSLNQMTNGGGTVGSLSIYGGNDSNLFIQQFQNSNASISTTRNSTALSLSTHYSNNSAPIIFNTSPGGGTIGLERMRITGEGNVGINTNTPTEKLDNNGITRLRSLPLNGTANAINTTSGGTASSAQDQTFTATRTVVADANGVLGYVTGLPGTGGGTAPSGSISVGETISAVYSVPVATATVGSGGFRLGAYAAANGLTALPSLDGIQMDLLGYSSDYYTPIIINTASAAQLISYQTFATQVNENRTLLNQSLSPCPFAANTFTTNLWDGSNATGWRGVDANNIVYWNTANAEVETTNLQVQVDANTYRWYEFKWWCMEVSGNKKIFLSVTRKA